MDNHDNANTEELSDSDDNSQPPPRKRRRKIGDIYQEVNETSASIRHELDEIKSNDVEFSFKQIAQVKDKLQWIKSYNFSKLNVLLSEQQQFIVDKQSRVSSFEDRIDYHQDRIQALSQQKNNCENILNEARDNFKFSNDVKDNLEKQQLKIKQNIEQSLDTLFEDYETWNENNIKDFLINNIFKDSGLKLPYTNRIEKFDINAFPKHYPTTWKIYGLLMSLGLEASVIDEIEKLLQSKKIYCAKMK